MGLAERPNDRFKAGGRQERGHMAGMHRPEKRNTVLLRYFLYGSSSPINYW